MMLTYDQECAFVLENQRFQVLVKDIARNERKDICDRRLSQICGTVMAMEYNGGIG